MDRASGNPVDAKPDQWKIKAPIWNQFAEIVGGKPIKNYIEFDNALNRIEQYLDNASLDKQDKVAELYNFHKVTQEEVKEYDDKAMAFLNELASDTSKIQYSKEESTNPFDKGGYEVEAKLPDGRGVSFYVFKDNDISTICVNFDTTPNGVNGQKMPIDYDDVYYGPDSSIVYNTNDGPREGEPCTSSDAYYIRGADTAKVQELITKIMSGYKEQE